MEIEKAQYQRPRQAEQRRGKRDAHARQRRRQPALQVAENDVEITGARRQAGDHVADRFDGEQESPEGAEQPEEDQKPDEVTGNFSEFIEARGYAVEQMAHGNGGHG